MRPLLERTFGARVTDMRSVRGGDINDAHRVALDDGRVLFVKTSATAAPGVFTAEARGLAALAATGAVAVPAVVHLEDGPDAGAGARFLALEWIEAGRPAPDHDVQLGRALAALHRWPGATLGLDHDNWVATIAQDNTPADDWPTFYARRRLDPVVHAAIDHGLLPSSVATRFEALAARLPDLVGPAEPPALLHGDLWSGNVMRDHAGAPVFVDPAVYGGHREVDLAMMRLFGGFSSRVFGAYDEAYPLADGHVERVPLYHLYPLLVHTLLFGGSYASAALAALATYA